MESAVAWQHLQHGGEAADEKGDLLLALIAVTFSLTACSPADQGAVTRDGPSGLPALVLALCQREGITGVRLYEASLDGDVFTTGRVLWAIEAPTPQPIMRFVVGQAPPGFVERAHLDPSLPGRMVLTAEADGGLGAAHGGYFESKELQDGILLRGGREVSTDDLEKAARSNCSDGFVETMGLFDWVGWVLLAGLASAMGVGVVALWRWRSVSSRVT
ncbi:MAG TPA: hypothetical protein VG795_09190, partial [Acidimicrobiia bacterium]|nr:hypothetical protein [Acidimicrobiia bacterium]